MLKRTRAVGALLAAAVALTTLPAAVLAADASAIEGLVAGKAAVLDLLHRKAEKALVTALCAALGLLLLYGVGFAQPQALYNAAHDARHALAFPCH